MKVTTSVISFPVPWLPVCFSLVCTLSHYLSSSNGIMDSIGSSLQTPCTYICAYIHTYIATKEFFPNIKGRLKTKINLTPNFTAMTTAHGKTRSYPHCFKIIESPECLCAKWNQTVLLYQCNKLNSEREALIGYISKEDNWPVKKKVLVNKYLKQFTNFTN